MIICILLLALILRLFGIEWDGGYHLHPDERMLVMVAQRITFFSQLDPQFFNYGSLPVYLLSGITQAADAFFHTNLATYGGQLYVGRILSALFDTGSVILVYLIAQRLWKNQQVALWGSLAYAIAVFPIQNSHFFVVDPLLTFFFIALLHQLITYLQEKRPNVTSIICIAIICAAAITTKFTGILFVPIAGIVIIYKHWENMGSILTLLLLFGLTNVGLCLLFMPYAFIHLPQFISDISLQLRMNNNAYIFPYTLQYVGTTAYWYPLKNIVLWGLGPVYALLAFYGIAHTIRHHAKDHHRILHLLILGSAFLYF
ncbi:MAG: glycosyltransferase family 39 protein [Candidatus Roizmanbacteria bacterium]|nr:glycosyltransferase family 39 protein [Candidatus Roizmanbacteria bacterium]